MITAQELDLLAAERARRGLTIPLDQMLLWAALMMDMGGPRRLARSENTDALMRAVRESVKSSPRARGSSLPTREADLTPSAVLADALEEDHIPGAHVVRWHANNVDKVPTINPATRMGGMEGRPLLLADQPQSLTDFSASHNPGSLFPVSGTHRIAPDSPLFQGFANKNQYVLGLNHIPTGESSWSSGVVHAAAANSWEELAHLIQDFPRWAKKLVVQHAVRSFGKPGKPNVRKLARNLQPQFVRTSAYVPGGAAGEKRIAERAEDVAAKPTSFSHLLSFIDHLNDSVPQHPATLGLQHWLETGSAARLKAHYATNPTDVVSTQVKRALQTRAMKLARKTRPIKLARSGSGASVLAHYIGPDGNIPLYHFAHPSLAHEASFTTDPGKFGKNPWSSSERKVEGTPKTFFYTDLRDQEGFFGGKPLFTASYPASKIYDATADPEGHVEGTYGGITGLIRKLRDSGYHGMFYSGAFPTVAMWEPVTVTKHEEEEPQKQNAIGDKVSKIMHEGVRGKPVKKDQAVAIAYSMQKAHKLAQPAERPRSHVYVSSNTREGTQMHDAYRMFASPEHDALVKATPGGRSGYGVWTDGAEDARVVTAETPDQLAILADSLGKQFKQKAVATFNEHTGGADALHVFTVRENDPEKVHGDMLSYGIEHKTILPSPGGLEIHILDPGKQLDDAVESYASGVGAHVQHHEGTVEFRPTK